MISFLSGNTMHRLWWLSVLQNSQTYFLSRFSIGLNFYRGLRISIGNGLNFYRIINNGWKWCYFYREHHALSVLHYQYPKTRKHIFYRKIFYRIEFLSGTSNFYRERVEFLSNHKTRLSLKSFLSGNTMHPLCYLSALQNAQTYFLSGDFLSDWISIGIIGDIWEDFYRRQRFFFWK